MSAVSLGKSSRWLVSTTKNFSLEWGGGQSGGYSRKREGQGAGWTMGTFKIGDLLTAEHAAQPLLAPQRVQHSDRQAETHQSRPDDEAPQSPGRSQSCAVGMRCQPEVLMKSTSPLLLKKTGLPTVRMVLTAAPPENMLVSPLLHTCAMRTPGRIHYVLGPLAEPSAMASCGRS